MVNRLRAQLSRHRLFAKWQAATPQRKPDEPRSHQPPSLRLDSPCAPFRPRPSARKHYLRAAA
jgi:hypothetical protein